MRRVAALCVLLWWCGPAWGQVTLPETVKGESSAFVRVTAEAKGQVQWYSPDAGLAVFPAELLKDSRTAVVLAIKPGRYRLVAWTAAGDVPSPPAITVVVIGEAPPVPPGPGPGPQPEPTDPLYVALKAAWAKEADPKRGEYRASLAALYRLAAEKTAQDPALKTLGDLLGVLRRASADLLPSSALPAVRRAVGDHLNATLGTAPASPLDAATRSRCQAAFLAVSNALEALK